MSVMQMVLLAGGISFGFMLFLVLLMLLKPWRFLSKNTVEGQRNRYRISVVYSGFALKVYGVLNKFYPTHVLMLNLAAMFSHMYVLDEEKARVKSISSIIIEIVVGSIAFAISVIYFKDTMLSLIMALMMAMYAYYKVRGDGQKFLEELEEAIGDMVHMYNAEGNNIDRMFNRVLEDRNSYMFKYLDQMYSYLKRAVLDTSTNDAINEYNNMAASRHLRLMFNYLYITYRYGDEYTSEGENLFNRNMLAIQREIHADASMLIQVKNATMGEQWFIILGVAMIPGATWYMQEFFTFDGFEAVGRFLSSSFGYSVKLCCAVFALICYYIYMKLMESNAALEFHREISWEEDILNKHRKMAEFIDLIAPKESTARRKKLELDVSMTEGYVGIRPLYLKKILTGVVISAITASFLIIDTYSNYSTIAKNMYLGVNAEMMTTIINSAQDPDAYVKQCLENDMVVIDILRENEDEYFSFPTLRERQEYVIKTIKKNNIDYGIYYEAAAQRVVEKYTQISQINIPLMSGVVFIAFFGAYMMPNLTMKLNLLLNKGSLIYNEVNGCYTVVVLLINHSASNVAMIISWITSFSKIFKQRFQLCKDNLSEKEILALDDGIHYKPLNRLIECILLAYRGADLKSAFAGIEQRHLFQEEARRIMNERIIKQKSKYSEIISWLAMGFTFALYIMMPMIMAIGDMLFQLQM